MREGVRPKTKNVKGDMCVCYVMLCYVLGY